ncbi:CidA/LrgA family protein [Orrella sp. JC864]|uniref:CidA/LrgA family protein n=1 Tax=Orrella sp. JC864 TaxID=3120298 RepID=UPI0012BD604B
MKTLRSASIVVRRALRGSRLLQIVLLAAFSLAGDAAVRLAGLPIPGGVIGMLLVLALLASRRMGVGMLRRGSRLLLAEMLLFFVPAVMSLLDHGELLGLIGVKLLAVIVLGTLLVMSVTALTIDACYRWSTRHAA